MKKSIFIIVVCFSMSLISLLISAVPAKPGPMIASQPDGTTITVYMFGDERRHWTTTEDGYFIGQNAEGFFVYVIEKNDGTWHLTPVRAHDIHHRTIEEKEFLEMKIIEKYKLIAN